MKHKIFKFLFIITIILCLFGCGEKEQPSETPKEDKEYTVTLFYDEDIVTKKVKENSIVDYAPLDTDNYIFLGWYNEEYTECFDNTTVTSNLFLFAKLIKKGVGFNITYNLDGGEFDGKQVKRYVVGAITELPKAKKEPNFEFVGWMVNGNPYNTILSIDDSTYNDLVLTAKYIDHNTYCKIKYVTNGGTLVGEPITTYRVGDDNFINNTYATKEGYYFRGWYLEETLDTCVQTITSDFTTDLTLYAKYVEATAANTYVSILGDSISTFEGEIPNGYITYYPAGDVTSKERTWWYMAAQKLGYTILSCNSFSGSFVSKSEIPAALSYASCYERLQHVAKDGMNPDVIFIHMGTNDFTHGVSNTTFETAYKTMLEMIKYYYDDVKIYVCLHPYNKYADSYIKIRLDYNEIITKLANEFGCTILDLTTVITVDNVNDMMYAGSHPNYTGMKAIANFVYQEVSK